MRDIKYKGKRVDNGKWVYGFCAKSIPEESETYIMPEFLYNCYEIEEKGTWTLRFDKYYQVIPETVGQFTGLKDKNGVEIYESDILLWSNGYKHCDKKEVVKFINGCFLSVGFGENKIASYSDGGTTFSFRVIGNIHDDKHLLG